MEKAKKLLEKFLDLLEKENTLLIESIKSKEASNTLLETIEEKEITLTKILKLEKKDVEPYKELLFKIDDLTQRNKLLASNNLEFINDIFEAIYEKNSTTQYTKDGNIEKKRETILNKKV